MSTTNFVFEQFAGIDIKETTLHGLVETLREKRDFTDEGIEKMLIVNSIKPGVGSPKVRIYLYPDMTLSMNPIYDSDEVTWA